MTLRRQPQTPSENQLAAQAFAAQFTPPLKVCQTAKMNNQPMRDCWMAAIHDQATGMGITAHFWAGQSHVYLEYLGQSQDAATAGQYMARWYGEATGGQGEYQHVEWDVNGPRPSDQAQGQNCGSEPAQARMLGQGDGLGD